MLLTFGTPGHEGPPPTPCWAPLPPPPENWVYSASSATRHRHCSGADQAPTSLRPSQQYQQRLAALGPGLKVGMAWRSRKTRSQDTHYPPLTQWGALLTLPGVHFVNLQYDDPRGVTSPRASNSGGGRRR